MSARKNALLELARHSSVYAVGNLLAKLASFLMLPLYTAYLTPFDYGVLDIVETTAGMIGLVLGFGMASSLGRFYFDSDDAEVRKRTVSTAIALASVSAVVIIGLSIPVSGPLVRLLFGAKVDSSVLVWAMCAIGVGLVADLGNIYLRLVNRSVLYVGISLANMIIGIGLNVYFIVGLKLGVLGILYSSVITKVIVGLPPIFWILRKVGMRVDRAIAASMYRYGAPLMPSELASVAIGYSDRYFINGFLSTADAGIYGMAQKLGTVLHYLVSSPFLTAFMTQRFEIGQRTDAPPILATAFRYHMVVLIVLSCGLSLYAYDVLRIMTASEFWSAGPLIPMVTMAMVVLGAKYHFEYGILRSKQTHLHMYVNLTSTALHVALNFVLIRYLGLWGALIATIIAYSIKCGGYLAFSQRLYRIPFQWARLLAFAAVGYIIAYLGARITLPHFWSLAAKSPLFVIATLAPLAMGLVSKAEISKAWALVRSRVIRSPEPGGRAS